MSETFSSNLERIKEAFRRGYDDVTRRGIPMGLGIMAYRRNKNEQKAYREGYLSGAKKIALLARQEIMEKKKCKANLKTTIG